MRPCPMSISNRCVKTNVAMTAMPLWSVIIFKASATAFRLLLGCVSQEVRDNGKFEVKKGREFPKLLNCRLAFRKSTHHHSVAEWPRPSLVVENGHVEGPPHRIRCGLGKELADSGARPVSCWIDGCIQE